MKMSLQTRLKDRWHKDVEFIDAYHRLLFAEEFATMVKKLRHEHKMTQMDLAQRTGIQQVEISKIENRKTIPTVGTIERILSVFHKRLTITDM